jgi:Zn-dependent protease
MGLISLLLKDPVAFIILVVPLLYSIIIHEVAHGWMAGLWGAQSHIDPLGALMLFLVGFGWARPVPVDYRNLRNFRAGIVCVALAGCAANILVATLALLILQLYGVQHNLFLSSVLLVIARINIMLGAFNLIPVPPLDGSKVLMGFLPRSMQRQLALLEPYGFFILAILIMTGALDPAIHSVQRVILWGIGSVLSLFR